MPISAYFKGKGTSVMSGMQKQYGAKKGKRVFYATANKQNMTPAAMPSGMGPMPMAGTMLKNVGYGDIGVRRQEESVKVGGFKSGKTESASQEFAEGGD